MRFDSLSMLAEAQKLTGTTFTGAKVINLGKAGLSNPPTAYVTIVVETALDQDTTFALKGSTNNSTFNDLISMNLAKADLVEGQIINLPLPSNCPQYLRLDVSAGSALTKGQITAGLQLAPQTPVDKAVFESAR